MRSNIDHGIKTKNNLNGETIAMGIKAKNMHKVLGILSNLYSDPAEAVVREYSTNARDSHIAAGKADVPIEVTLPDAFNPTFVVQDFGVGLNVDDIREIYAQYGESTKEDNDDETGYLGMGSKSGLTYADQFTVVAIKDGVKTIAVVTKDDSGGPTIRILDTVSTDEGNGVTIKIPVQNAYDFCNKAHKLYRYWKPGTVLINGVLNEGIEGKWITDDILVVQGSANDKVVMGSVAYPVNVSQVNISEKLPHNQHIVAFVPMGSVAFVPSREELHYTKLTLTTLNQYRQKIEANLLAAAKAEIEDAESATVAIKAAKEWAYTFRNSVWHYKGVQVPVITYGGLSVDVDEANEYRPYAARYKVTDATHISVDGIEDYVFVTNYPFKAVSATVRGKIDQYFEVNNLTLPHNIILADKQPNLPWTEACKVIDYDDIKSVVIPRAKRGNVGLSPWSVWRNDKWETEQDIQDPDLVFLSPTLIGHKTNVYIRDLQKLLPNVTFIEAGKNRWDRLRREYDDAQDIFTAVKAAHSKWVASLSDEQVAALTNHHLFEDFRLLSPIADRILDPEVREVVKAATGVQQAYRTVNERRMDFHSVKRGAAEVEDYYDYEPVTSPLADKAKNVLANYPFIGYTDRVPTDHTVAYVNAIYKENNQ